MPSLLCYVLLAVAGLRVLVGATPVPQTCASRLPPIPEPISLLTYLPAVDVKISITGINVPEIGSANGTLSAGPIEGTSSSGVSFRSTDASDTPTSSQPPAPHRTATVTNEGLSTPSSSNSQLPTSTAPAELRSVVTSEGHSSTTAMSCQNVTQISISTPTIIASATPTQ